MGGVVTPGARVVLVGSKGPQLVPAFFKDSDAFIFSEILEYGLSLAPVAKGQEPFSGLPYMQAYRLIRASVLAEFGDIQSANRFVHSLQPHRFPNRRDEQVLRSDLGMSGQTIALLLPHYDCPTSTAHGANQWYQSLRQGGFLDRWEDQQA